MIEEFNGIVRQVLICRETNSIRSESVDEVDVTFEGFAGDKHSGWTKPSDGRTKFYPRGTAIRNSRQVSIVSLEENRLIADELGIGSLLPEWMGANLLIEGIEDLSSLSPNSRLFFEGGVVMLVTEENHPCATMSAEIARHFPEDPDLAGIIVKASMHRRGIVAVVELPGKIKKGESVRVTRA